MGTGSGLRSSHYAVASALLLLLVCAHGADHVTVSSPKCTDTPPAEWGDELIRVAKTVCPRDLQASATCLHPRKVMNEEYQNELYRLLCFCMTKDKAAGMEDCMGVAWKLSELGDEAIGDSVAGHKTVYYWSGDVAKAMAVKESQESRGVAVSLEGTTIFGRFFDNDNAKGLGNIISQQMTGDRNKIQTWNVWGGLSKVYVQMYGPARAVARNIVVFGESVRPGNVFVDAELPELVKQQCTLDTTGPSEQMQVRFVLVDNRERMNNMVYDLLQQYIRETQVGRTPNRRVSRRNHFLKTLIRDEHAGMARLHKYLNGYSRATKTSAEEDAKCREFAPREPWGFKDWPKDKQEEWRVESVACMSSLNFEGWIANKAWTHRTEKNSEYWQALNYCAGSSLRADMERGYSPLDELRETIKKKLESETEIRENSAAQAKEKCDSDGEDCDFAEEQKKMATCMRGKTTNMDDWFHPERLNVDNVTPVTRIRSEDSPFEVDDALGADPDAQSCVDIDCYSMVTMDTCIQVRGLSDNNCCTWHEEQAPHCRTNTESDQIEAEMLADRVARRGYHENSSFPRKGSETEFAPKDFKGRY